MNQNNTLLYVVLAVIVYFLIVKPALNKERFGQEEDLSGIYKIDTNICSPDCCGSQWPVSFQMKKDDRIKEGDENVSTNMTCTGLRGRGCVCSNKNQFNFLKNRGNNS